MFLKKGLDFMFLKKVFTLSFWKKVFTLFFLIKGLHQELIIYPSVNPAVSLYLWYLESAMETVIGRSRGLATTGSTEHQKHNFQTKQYSASKESTAGLEVNCKYD